MSSSRTHAARSFALVQAAGVLGVTIALLAAIEFAAGIVVGTNRPPAPAPTPGIAGDTVSQTLTWLDLNPAPLVRDADLLWRNAPSARKTQLVNPQPWGPEERWTIENDGDGFRGPERAPGDPADRTVYRVVCIGDSVTFGFNVDQPNPYPRQLQILLETRFPGRRFEVINAGVPGWSWLQGLRFLELRGLALHPDVVVMGHGTNDQALPAKLTDDERFHRLGGPFTRALRSAAVRLMESNSYHLVERIFPPPPFSPDPDSPACVRQIVRTGACHRVSLDEIAAATSAAYALTTEHAVALLLLNLDFVGTPAVEGVRRTAEREGVPFLDAVDHARRICREREDDRATSLGLSPASLPAAPSSPKSRKPSRTALLRVRVPDRNASYEVRGSALFHTEFTFAEPLVDDGTGGDERSGDGVYSARIEVPPRVSNLRYVFHRDGEPELRPVPPLGSTIGFRIVEVPNDVIAPVGLFGKLDLMTERAHPDRDGQRIVAESVAEWLATLPSFQRFVADH